VPHAKTALAPALPVGHLDREIARKIPSGSLGTTMRTQFLHREKAARWRNMGNATGGCGSGWVCAETS